MYRCINIHFTSPHRREHSSPPFRTGSTDLRVDGCALLEIAWLDPQLDGFFLVCFFAQLFASIRCPLSNRANSPRIDGFPRNVLIPNPLTALRSSNGLRPLSRRNSRRCFGLCDFIRLACINFASDDKKLPIHQFTAHPVPRLPAKQLKRRAPPPGAPVGDSLQRGGAKKYILAN